MSTTQPQKLVPALPSKAENSPPAEAPRSISLERPSPADAPNVDCGEELAPGRSHKPAEEGAIPSPAPNTADSSIPDDQLTTMADLRGRMRHLVARIVVLSERIAASGLTREEL